MFKEVCEFTTNVDFKHFRTLVDMVAVEYYTKKEMKSMDKKMKLELYKPKVDPNFWKVPEKFMKHKKKELDKIKKKFGDHSKKNKKLSLYEGLMAERR